VQCGRAEEAITQYEIVLEKEPDLPAVNYNYANALVALARYGEAIKYYEKAVKLKPDLADAWCDFALMLAACPDGSVRNGARAIELAQQANTLTNGQDPSILDTLAAAHAEAGQFAEALRIARRAYQLAVQQGKLELAKSIQDKISLYEKGIPYREPPRRKP
jgi:tetratricopeptide (TPR) repeat protein